MGRLTQTPVQMRNLERIEKQPFYLSTSDTALVHSDPKPTHNGAMREPHYSAPPNDTEPLFEASECVPKRAKMRQPA
jgi:hypothetical protein